MYKEFWPEKCDAAIVKSAYQYRPISPPPRMWAIAKTHPRSNRQRRLDEKYCKHVCSRGCSSYSLFNVTFSEGQWCGQSGNALKNRRAASSAG
eukprot:scaffold310827_cov12-Tisochrysis_lutea.AAC.1